MDKKQLFRYISTANTYHSRYFTCRCQRSQEGPNDAIKQAIRAPPACLTTPRNPKTTAEGLAQSQYQKQKYVGRGPRLTMQQSSKRKTQKVTHRMDGTYVVKEIHANGSV